MASLLDRTSYKFEDIPVTHGAVIDKSVYAEKESRFKTLFIKAVIVYLLTAGGIGCYLTALSAPWHQLIVNVLIFISAIICTFLYYSYVVENIGYLFVFGAFFGGVVLLKGYINSGFYGIVNITIENLSTYLDVEGMQQYSEKYSNRELTITIAVIFIGIVFNIVLNVFISRRMQFIMPLMMVMPANLVPLYMEKEPDTFYELMLLSALVMMYIMRGGRHYRMRSTDSVFLMGRKKTLEYNYNSRSVWQTLVYGIVAVLIAVSVINIAFPKDDFDYNHADNKYKASTMETVSNVILLGIGGLFNYYYSTAGLVGGQLGGVSSIHLDYQTDLTVTVTPYTYDSIYLKSFTGGNYLPYSNRWEQISLDMTKNAAEAEALKEAFLSGKESSAKARIDVKNVATNAGWFLPYYGEMEGSQRIYLGSTVSYTVYPRNTGNTAKISEKGYQDVDLLVPEENVETIDEFIREAGLSGNNKQVMNQLKNYFQQNIPYTIKPGATPKKDDFVNYFLSKNKKGYCAHFASSATLILRRMGIPARYVEGYAVSYNEMVDKGELTEEKYSEYYSGYSEMGETGVITIDATDADAHAWVEVYDEEYGWQVYDPTPSAGEEDSVDFWSAFSRFMNNNSKGDSGDDGEASGEEGFKVNDEVMMYIAVLVLSSIAAFGIVFAVRFLVPFSRRRNEYKKTALSRKLVMEYEAFRRKVRRRDAEFKKKINYKEELSYLMDEGIITHSEEGLTEKEDLTDMISLFEKAEFSPNEISREEYNKGNEFIRDALLCIKNKK